MKKVILLLITSLIFQRCALPPPILSATYSLDLPNGAGVQGNPQFTEFQSSSSGSKTTLTFIGDGESLVFVIDGLQAGNTFNLSGANTLEASLLINDENGVPTNVQFEGNGTGSITVTGLNGAGGSISGMSGSFQANIQIAGEDGPPSSLGSGTILGEFSFNNSAQ